MRFGSRAGERGQLAISFLFVIPSLLLFVFLIYEVAKLSREKIRHQFAADSAAFVEATQYSDFLNRTAYVNGAFPQKLFREGLWNICIQHKRTHGELENRCTSGFKGDRLYEILAKNGAFPRWLEKDQEGIDEIVELDSEPSWLLRFQGCGEAKNSKTPDLDSCKEAADRSGTLQLLTIKDANDYWITWDDAKDVYNLYVQIYQMLGSIEDSLYEVFKANAGRAYFYSRSYQLNSGESPLEGARGAESFARFGSSFAIKPYCAQAIKIHGTKPAKSIYMPYQVFKPNEPLEMEETIRDCSPGPGLMQAVTVAPEYLSSLRTGRDHDWPGVHVVQPIDLEHKTLGENYFGVNFHVEGGMCPWGSGPCVSAAAAVANPAQDSGNLSSRNGIWPDPTPKFQTRLYP